MPERTSYTQGTPNWVDLPTSDQAAAKAFYAGLFGWTYDDQPMGEGQVYSMAMLGGHQVAAISTQSAEMTALERRISTSRLCGVLNRTLMSPTRSTAVSVAPTGTSTTVSTA